MSEPSNGIAPKAIRQVMPPYLPDPDLLQATLAARPRKTPRRLREARVACLTQEISERMPANATPARTATARRTPRPRQKPHFRVFANPPHEPRGSTTPRASTKTT